jgi:hypothetical protein
MKRILIDRNSFLIFIFLYEHVKKKKKKGLTFEITSGKMMYLICIREQHLLFFLSLIYRIILTN